MNFVGTALFYKNAKAIFAAIILQSPYFALKLKFILFFSLLRSGLNFINILCTAFTLADPESVKSY